MRSDREIQQDVTEELSWDPKVDVGRLGLPAAGRRTGNRHITGVTGVANLVSVRPRATATEVDEAISAAFARNATLNSLSVRAEIRNGRADLYGRVHSLYERTVAERAAEAAPGVTSVESHIEVAPHA